jgi:DNA-binding GntR family transcriptional regulator
LSSLDRSTLRERALEALRSAITSGQYRPGDHLGEVELASHLGVSRGTVREALRHLQQEGLVTAGNRGMLRVNSLTPAEVRELFRVRAALEGVAVAEITASSEREAAVVRLREALTLLADADGDFAARVEADLGFHLLLCQLAGNSMLVEGASPRRPDLGRDHERRARQRAADDVAGPALADHRRHRAGRRVRGGGRCRRAHGCIRGALRGHPRRQLSRRSRSTPAQH